MEHELNTEYDNYAAKTSFVREELRRLRESINLVNSADLVVNGNNVNEDKEAILDRLLKERNDILDNESLCYSQKDTKARMENGIIDDIYTEIMTSAKAVFPSEETEITSVMADLSALEDSVLDSKIAYSEDYKDVLQAELDAAEAIQAAENMIEYDGSSVDIPSLIKQNTEVSMNDKEQSKMENAYDAFNKMVAGKDGSENSIAGNLSDLALMEVGRHPFRYAIYAAKENFKEISQNVKVGRELVKASEGTYLDTVKATIDSAKSSVKRAADAASAKINDNLDMAMQAGRNACVTASENLNIAYTKGSDFLAEAKQSFKKVAVMALQKADQIMEKLTGGLFSKALESTSRKAFVSQASEEQTIGDKLAQGLINAHIKTHGIGENEMSDYIADMKNTVWDKTDGKSFADRVVEQNSQFQYNTTLLVNDVNHSYNNVLNDTANMIATAKKECTEVKDVFHDQAVAQAKLASLRVKRELANLSSVVCTNAMRFYDKIHKVNEYRVNNTIQKCNANNDKLLIANQMKDTFEKNAPEKIVKQTYTVPENVRVAIESLQTIENPTTAEKFALSLLEMKVADEASKFDQKEAEKVGLNEYQITLHNLQLEYENENITALTEECNKSAEKLDSLINKGNLIVDKINAFADKSMAKAKEAYNIELEIENLKKEMDAKTDTEENMELV